MNITIKDMNIDPELLKHQIVLIDEKLHESYEKNGKDELLEGILNLLLKIGEEVDETGQ